MSATNTPELEPSGNDGRTDDDSIEPNPLGDKIAEVAPYANSTNPDA